MNDAKKGWSDYWEKDSAEGEVFVDAEGERHPALGDFWRVHFESLPDGARVIDLASGAGSIYAHLPEEHTFQLSATDISDVALNALQDRYPQVSTIECSADAIPLDDGSFDAVVTQFGAEYAGIGAFAEAARLIAPGGKFIGLCHIRDGYIDSSNRGQMAEAKILLEQAFIDHATRMITAAFSGDADALKNSQDAFVTAAGPVVEGMSRCKKGIHTYLYQGFRQLYERRHQYDLADITGWLDAMRGELDINLDRLSRMCAAALTESDIDEIRRIFEEHGLKEVHCTPFETAGNTLPVAWNLTAQKGSK
ncbi:MAG: methyltransferase domain-containing protein [Gammaproteobacteria bacterium]|jgi:SAM-dependent methyltransferase|nr:methyltransferase domain-containing protein [Gammaproteobacteria bacterium]